MRIFTYRSRFIIAVLMIIGFLATANGLDYTVRAGDTLSQIAQAHFAVRVYGKNGSLQKLLSLNSKSGLQADKIHPDEQISLGESVAQSPLTNTDAVREPAVATENATAPNISVAPPTVQSEIRSEQSSLLIAPRFTFNRIDAKDLSTQGQSNISSDLSVGGELRWTQIWPNNLTTGLAIGFDTFREKSVGKTLDQAKFTSAFLEVQLGYKPTENWNIYLGLSGEQAPFMHATSSQTITLESVDVPEVHLGFVANAARTNLFRLEYGLEGGLRFGSSHEIYDVKTGYDANGFINLTQVDRKLPLYARLFYNFLSQDTTITKQYEQIVGLSIGLHFESEKNSMNASTHAN